MRAVGIVFLAVSFITGCAAPMTQKMSRLSVGMTKAEAIAVMGSPASVAAQNGVEYLNYRLATSFLDTDGSDTSDYFVQIMNGRVSSYGQRGDFNTTTMPQERVQVEVIHK